MAAMVMQISSSSVLSTPPPTPPMENPSNYPLHRQAPSILPNPPPVHASNTHRGKKELCNKVSYQANSGDPTSIMKSNSAATTKAPLITRASGSFESNKLKDDDTSTENQEKKEKDLEPCSLPSNQLPAEGVKKKHESVSEKTTTAVSSTPTATDIENVVDSSANSSTNNKPVGVSSAPGRPRARSGVTVGGGQAPKFHLTPEEYFRGVSPMSRRLLEDMATVRESWGQDWAGLSYEQQCKILDQAIVDEATVRRYESAGLCSGPDCEYFPKLRLHTGQNVIRDEKLSERGYTCSWRDEHSAPFSWHTRSQMDLTLDTPPETPLDQPSFLHDLHQQQNSTTTPSSTNTNNTPTTATTIISNSSSVSGNMPSGCNASTVGTFTSHPQKKSNLSRRTNSAFSWHYEPSPRPLKSSSLDIPDVILETSSKKRSNLAAAHVVVRAAGEGESGFWLLERLRGVFCRLTASCLPTHDPAGTSSVSHSHSIHANSSAPPDLRPPHVLAQANAVSRGVNATTPITLPITSTVSSSLASTTSQSRMTADASINSVPSLLQARTPTLPNHEVNEEFTNNNNNYNNNTNNNNNYNSLVLPSSSHGNVTEVSPTHSGTNITANPLAGASESSLNRVSASSSYSTINRSTQKRRAPEPSKKPAPLPPVVRPLPPKKLQSPPATEPVAPTTTSGHKFGNANDNLNLVNFNNTLVMIPLPVDSVDCHREQTPSPPPAVELISPPEEVVKEDAPLVDLSTSGEDFIPKTGFDFLDDW